VSSCRQTEGEVQIVGWRPACVRASDLLPAAPTPAINRASLDDDNDDNDNDDEEEDDDDNDD